MTAPDLPGPGTSVTIDRWSDLEPAAFVRWRVRARDETFRSFDPERIARAIGKAMAAADNTAAPSPERLSICTALTRQVCTALACTRPDGGTVWLEEIQDQAELALMRAGEHEVARRFVLYREARRSARTVFDTPAVPGLERLLSRLADPLTVQDSNRFVLFPIRYDDLWRAYKEHLALLWTAEEIDMAKDQQDWRQLSQDERHFLSHVLAFFAASDGIVNENLAARFYHEVSAPEARAYYSMQMLIETIHSETYSLLIDTYITDGVERDRLLRAVETVPIVGEKARWALRWLEASRSLAERLVAFACVEGIFFSSSFCAIYWLKDMKRGRLPGLAFSNELIARDEGLHTDFAVLLHDKLQEKCPPERIRAVVAEAVDIECRFAGDALPVSLIGMNAEAMRQYIRFVADRLVIQFGGDPLYGDACPFSFMERIALQNKTNFHEKKVAEYRRAGVGVDIAEQRIAFDIDF